jgi:hypothetical protein
MTIFFCILIIFGLAIFFQKKQEQKLIQTVTKLHRGTDSERNMVLKLLKSKVPADVIFHDLYLENYKDNYTQIDLVLVTKVGIIVIEVKEYSGWIFGTGNKPKWTQVLAYGKNKYNFYNPIFQNKKHIADLKKQHKQLDNIPFYSIVVFYGNCVFKDINLIPDGTFIVKSGIVLDVIKKILQENNLIKYTNENEVKEILTNAVKNGDNKNITMRHIENIKSMLGE